MITLAFFNNKGEVGATSLVSHLAWMFADYGVPVLAVDLDPQANLTSMLVADERVQELWSQKKTLFEAVRPLMDGGKDIQPGHAEFITSNLHLLAGDLSLSCFEDLLAEKWIECLAGEVGAFQVISAFYRIMADAAQRVGALLVLVDVGPSLGPLNRSALLACDRLVLPVAPDLFSLKGMENLGPTLRNWRAGWNKRVEDLRDGSVVVPRGAMDPMGYVLVSFGARDSRPTQSYNHRVSEIPGVYRRAVLGQPEAPIPSLEDDPFRLAALKHYRSLMPLAVAARKPMFFLKPADGARGAHLDAVRACYHDFDQLARQIGNKLGIPIS